MAKGKQTQPRAAPQPDSKRSKKKQAKIAMMPDRNFSRTGVFPFLKVPFEIQTMIVKLLNPVTSTCLGLTCKHLYQLHRKHRGNVDLRYRLNDSKVGYLPYLLEEWMAPRVFRFGSKFYTDERFQAEMAWKAENKEDKRKAKRERKMAKMANKRNGILAAP